MYHHRSSVLNEKRIDSPVVGWRQGRAASADADLELAVVGGRRHQGFEDLKAQTCPPHARARRVVIGHGSPALRWKGAATRRTLRR
jgi:hypothetical protein